MSGFDAIVLVIGFCCTIERIGLSSDKVNRKPMKTITMTEHPLGVRLALGQADSLKVIAKSLGLNRNRLIRLAIDEFLERNAA